MENSGQAGGATGAVSKDGAGAPESPALGTATETVLRRLNRTEYDNTITDLLGIASTVAQEFPRDEKSLGFDNNGAALTVPTLLVERYFAASESLARTAVSKLDTLIDCASAATDDCAARFIADFGERAWRRPLGTEEKQLLQATYTKGKQRDGFKSGIELVVRSLLLAPDFLFRIEVGSVEATKPGFVKLNTWEIASRLSYFLWQTMPDQALFEAARKGALATPQELALQAERMLKHPKARATVQRFFEQWLGVQPLVEGALNKDAALFPDWSKPLASAMHHDLTTFIEEVVWAGDGGLPALFQSKTAHVDAALAKLYGVPGTGRVELNDNRAAGVLARAGLLATFAHHNQTSPTHRGVFVRKQLLCQDLPPPPPSVNNVPSVPNPTQTTRERLAQHASDPSCAGCHRLIDPIGVTFEHFDAMGRWRDQESNKPIDARGEIVDSVGLEGSIDGLAALGNRMAQSTLVRDCVARQWLRFAHGRKDGAQDANLIANLSEGLRKSNGNIPQLLLGLVTSPDFVTRPVQEIAP